MEWLWHFLPDECEISDCCRKGVRGKENRIFPFQFEPSFYIVMCDYCNSRYHSGEVLRVDGLKMSIAAPKSQVVDLLAKRRLRRVSGVGTKESH